MSTEIARVVDFSTEQIDLLKRTICVGATDDEFALFRAQCRRTGLDPFARQIHAVKRFDKKQGREVMSIQIGIDGFRLIADRTGLYDGQGEPLWCGPDGVWRDVWIGATYPTAAKVTVYRTGVSRPFVGIAHWDEYAQVYKDGNPMPMWAQMPAGQLAKCAESLALRKAFPQELSGLYEPTELEQTETPAPRPTVTQPKGDVKPAPQSARVETVEQACRALEAAGKDPAARQRVWDTFSAPLQDGVTGELVRRKEERRAAKAMTHQHPETKEAIAAPEGEQRSDPSSAPTANAPTAAASSASAASAPAAAAADAPRTMPAAEHRTAPPASGPLPPEKLARITAITKALDELDLVWNQVRDRSDPRAKDIAEACGLPMVPATRLAQLPDPLQDELLKEAQKAVAAQREKAEARERNRAKKQMDAQERQQEAVAPV